MLHLGWAVLFSFVFSSQFAVAGLASKGKTDWYSRIGALYSKGNVPESSQVRAQQAWRGKCSEPSRRTELNHSVLYLHVDRDPVSGNRFQMIPLLNTAEDMPYIEVREEASRLIENNHLTDTVRISAIEKAWYMSLSGSHRESRIAYLKAGVGAAGQTLLFLKIQGTEAVRTYCYYYEPEAP